MIEVGPGQTLAALVRQHIGDSTTGASCEGLFDIAALRGSVADTAFLLETLGRLWIGGQSVDWVALYRGEAGREFRYRPTRSSDGDSGSSPTTRPGAIKNRSLDRSPLILPRPRGTTWNQRTYIGIY